MSYSEALRNREFRGMVVAQVASQWGDQLARLALAVFVLERTDNAFYASLAFAMSYLPDVIGGPLLGPVADRMPRRRVMLGCDLARMLLVGSMAIPGLGTGALLVLLLLSALFATPFAFARSALLPDLLPGATYMSGLSLVRLLDQVNQALGLLFGGLVLSVLHPRGALLADSITFFVSYVVVLLTLRPRPVERADIVPGLRGFVSDIREGADLVFRRRLPRALVLLGWISGLFCVIPEGVGVAYAIRDGYSAAAGAILVGSMPAGFTVGLLLLNRFAPGPRQFAIVLRLAALSFVPLLLTAGRPPTPVVAVLWFISGAFQANLVAVIGAFNLAMPSGVRGRANGLAAGGLGLAQTLAIAGGGLVANVLDPAAAVAWGAVLGLVALSFLAAWWPSRELDVLAERTLGPAVLPVEMPS